MKVICRFFGHKITGDDFHGHFCKRCGRWFDWGILEQWNKPIPYGTVITVPKYSPISEDEIQSGW